MRIDTKTQLAKLLSSENINVVHKIADTASFNLKDRTLILPMLKKASVDVYDLFIGHEVSHALHTPPDEYIENAKKYGSSLMNIVEDARIEKLICRKYPGLKKNFITGYKELFEKKFFGIFENGVDEMKLLDKINVHFKCGHLIDIQFDESVLPIIHDMDNMESFQDAINVVVKLSEYIKDNYSEEEIKIELLTENIISDNLEFEIDMKQEPEYVYIPDNVDYLIEKINIKTINKFTSMLDGIQRTESLSSFNKMENSCKKTIDMLLRNFNLRKNASQRKKVKISTKGDLNENKLHLYKITDDVFKKIKSVGKGKSHGLVLLMDMSGSITEFIVPMIRQLYIISMFCKKANIPFSVITFTSNGGGFYHTYDIISVKKQLNHYKQNDLFIDKDGLQFNEFINNKMNIKDINTVFRFFLDFAEHRFITFARDRDLSNLISYGSTPLTEVALAATSYIEKMQAQYKLDIMNFVILTDGEPSTFIEYSVNGDNTKFIPRTKNLIITDRKTKITSDLLKRTYDRPNVRQYKIILDITKQRLNQNFKTNYICFYITKPLLLRNKFSKEKNFEEMRKEFLSEGIISKKDDNFDKYFIIKTVNDDLEFSELLENVESDTITSLANAFKKYENNKKHNKLIADEFIGIIV